MQGVFLDFKSLDNSDIELTALSAVLSNWQWFDSCTDQQVAERIQSANVVITNKVKLTAAMLQAARQLKLVCVAATGTNNVDLEAAAALGITVCNVRNYATPSVVQHVFTLMLALTTRLPQYQAAVAQGMWQKSSHFCLLDFPITEISGKTLGIVGYGVLGQAVAKVADAFGMEVLISARPGTNVRAGRMALRDVLGLSDVVSLHCPLTPQTLGLIGRRELQYMKPNALIINTARGGIIDEVALLDAIKQQRIGGAGIDVLTAEPPVRGNPLLSAKLDNLIVTPHIAWSSREARQRLVNEVSLNIDAYLKGNPRNVVT